MDGAVYIQRTMYIVLMAFGKLTILFIMNKHMILKLYFVLFYSQEK